MMSILSRASSTLSPPMTHPPLRSLWDRSMLRRLILALAILKITGLVLVFDIIGKLMQPFDLAKSAFSRSTEWLLAALVLIALVRFGAGILPRSTLHVFVGAFLLINLASAVFAENIYVAVFGAQGRYLGFTFALDMVILYFAIVAAFRSVGDWAWLGGGIFVAWIGAMSYAAVQFVGADPLAWTETARERPFGTLGNPDMFGHFLSFAFAAGLSVALLATPQWPPFVRWIGIAVALASTLAAAIVATRGNLLGMTAAIL